MNVIVNHDRVAVLVGEALATLRAFPDKYFDMVLTDPPYSPHVHEHFGKERRNDGGKVQEALRFPPMTPELIGTFATEYVRISKGWILSFADFYTSPVWGRAIEDAGGAWVRTGQWVKTNPKPQMTGDRPACGAEDILIGHASPDTLEGRRAWDWNGRGKAAIWRGPADRNPIHPNQKPLWLVQALLGMFAPANALVLDAFFGSGTTAIAALQTERVVGEVCVETACRACARKRAEEYAPPLPVNVSVVGIEGDPAYAADAVERIQACLNVQTAA